jgi:hypothetical protein
LKSRAWRIAVNLRNLLDGRFHWVCLMDYSFEVARITMPRRRRLCRNRWTSRIAPRIFRGAEPAPAVLLGGGPVPAGFRQVGTGDFDYPMVYRLLKLPSVPFTKGGSNPAKHGTGSIGFSGAFLKCNTVSFAGMTVLCLALSHLYLSSMGFIPAPVRAIRKGCSSCSA